MKSNLPIEEIIKRLGTTTNEFILFCSGINDGLFFSQPPGKWSVAQNLEHLILSAKKTKIAYSLPKLILKLYAGTPNRSSRSYDELIAKYKLKLQQGGRAGTPFTPKTIPPEIGKEKMLKDFSEAMNRLIKCIQQNWTDKQLDLYIAPHPLLGKITQRELCYFTIHHTYHHLEAIKARLNEFAATAS